MITKTELARYQSQLMDLIAQLESQSASTTGDRAAVTLDQQSVGRLSRMDAMQQQAMAQATEQRRQGGIARAKAALARLEEGEFGFCVECGEDIARNRLDHDPSLATCLDCARSR